MTPADAWARLLGVERLERFAVLVDAASLVTRAGWIGILAIGDTVTVRVPRADLVGALERALGGLEAAEVIDPAVVVPRLPDGLALDTLGPANLYYPPPGYEPPASDAVVVDAAELLAGAAPEDLDESGIAESDSPVFGVRSADGSVVAGAAGYRVWPNGVAHLSVLTDAAHRDQGVARRAAAGAIAHALDAGLLPQWRARVVPSQRVALALGFELVGGQFGVLPAG